MKFPSGLIARRGLLFVLLLSALLAVVYGLWRADWLRLSEARQPSLLQRLQVPQPSDPWELDAIFDGYRVKLALPQELDKVDTLPSQIQGTVRQRIEFRRRNIEVLRKVAVALDRKLESSRTIHLASHDQTLARVVMSSSPLFIRTSPVSPIAMYERVLAALPDYTGVDFFVPESSVSQVALRLRALGMEQRVRLHGEQEYELVEGVVPLRHRTTRWMRDLFWTAADQGGHSLLLLPLAFYQINDLSRPDNDYVEELDDELQEVVRVPLFFKGGNLLVGVNGGRRILFIGQDELKLNQDFYFNAFFYFPPQEEVLGLFKQLAGVDEVRVLPNSKHLFHLDMAMSVLNSKTVALIEPVDEDALVEDDRRVIAEMRRVLTEYGFHIIGVPTFADWVGTFKSPVNILIFTNRDSGRPSAIVPQFEDRLITKEGKSVSIYQKIKQAYADAGVKTVFAVNGFYQFGGNLHCVILPLK